MSTTCSSFWFVFLVQHSSSAVTPYTCTPSLAPLVFFSLTRLPCLTITNHSSHLYFLVFDRHVIIQSVSAPALLVLARLASRGFRYLYSPLSLSHCQSVCEPRCTPRQAILTPDFFTSVWLLSPGVCSFPVCACVSPVCLSASSVLWCRLLPA